MFTKGQIVTYITEWNDGKDFAYTIAEVVSCGKKQMALKCVESGNMMGRHYSPTGIDTWVRDGMTLAGTYADMTEAEVIDLCNSKSAARKDEEMEALANRRVDENDYWAPLNAALQVRLEASPKAIKHVFIW